MRLDYLRNQQGRETGLTLKDEQSNSCNLENGILIISQPSTVALFC